MNVNMPQSHPQPISTQQQPLTNPQTFANTQPPQGNANLNLSESAKKANLLLNQNNDEFDNFQTANTQDAKKQPANVPI